VPGGGRGRKRKKKVLGSFKGSGNGPGGPTNTRNKKKVRRPDEKESSELVYTYPMKGRKEGCSREDRGGRRNIKLFVAGHGT